MSRSRIFFFFLFFLFFESSLILSQEIYFAKGGSLASYDLATCQFGPEIPLARFIHQLLNPNYFPVFYECANPPFPVLTFCPRFLIKSPFYESFLMETQRENGRNIDFLMTGHIPPIEVFRPLVRITISP